MSLDFNENLKIVVHKKIENLLIQSLKNPFIQNQIDSHVNKYVTNNLQQKPIKNNKKRNISEIISLDEDKLDQIKKLKTDEVLEEKKVLTNNNNDIDINKMVEKNVNNLGIFHNILFKHLLDSKFLITNNGTNFKLRINRFLGEIKDEETIKKYGKIKHGHINSFLQILKEKNIIKDVHVLLGKTGGTIFNFTIPLIEMKKLFL